MNYVEKVLDNVQNTLNINAATLSGAIDIIVVPQEDGTLKSTPFHVRFGKLQLLSSSEKIIAVYVNDVLTDLKMKLGQSGEAFFAEETSESVPPSLATSPVGSPRQSRAALLRSSTDSSPEDADILTASLEQLALRNSNDSPDAQVIQRSIGFDAPEIDGKPLESTDKIEQKGGTKWGMVWGWGSLPRVKKVSPEHVAPQIVEAESQIQPEPLVVDIEKALEIKELDKPSTEQELYYPESSTPPSANQPPNKVGWTGKMGSLFRIFKGVEPQYIVKPMESSTAPSSPTFNRYRSDSQSDLDSWLSYAESTQGELLSEPSENGSSTIRKETTESGLALYSSSAPSREVIKLDSSFTYQDTDDNDNDNDDDYESAESSESDSEYTDPLNDMDLVEVETPQLTIQAEKQDKITIANIPEIVQQESSTTTSASQVDVTIKQNTNAVVTPIETQEHTTVVITKEQQTSKVETVPPAEPESLSPRPAPEDIGFLGSLTAEQLISANIQLSKCGQLIQSTSGANTEQVEKLFNDNIVSYEELSKTPEIIFDNNLVFRINQRMYPSSVGLPLIVSLIAFRKPLSDQVINKLQQNYVEKSKSGQKKSYWSYWWWRSNPKQPQAEQGTVTQTQVTDSVGNTVNVTQSTTTSTAVLHIRKSLRPTSDQLKSLNLRDGPNQIRFVVSSILQGTREVRATIYKWDSHAKVVISDIDGTITKSDVFGQILPILGRDWSHSGVVQLYSTIKANGYHILYLTARPIGQANITRGYISTLKQGEEKMPQGPVFMSPSRLLSAFNQEVILRRPEEFKIACLQDIQSLFPQTPFYAGFGNRPSDALSYRAVGIPLGKIYTINYKGEISIVNHAYKKTFSTLMELVNEMFPALISDKNVAEEWNSWNYWKNPLPVIQDNNNNNKKAEKSQEPTTNPDSARDRPRAQSLQV